MFLISVTDSEISMHFQSYDIEEIKAKSMIVSVVTDGFFNKCVFNKDGFIVLESPGVLNNDDCDLVFSKIEYNKVKQEIDVFKSTLSGRPIYYINSEGNFYCASHISLLKEVGVKIEENISVLPEYFIYFHVSLPETLYRNIKQLLPGSVLTLKILNERKCEVKSIKYFSFPRQICQQFDSIKDISKNVSERLSDTVRKLQPVKEKLAVLLSGGLDSSILFKIFHKYLQVNKTFSTGYPFENKEKNIEKEYALSAKEYFKTEHKYLELLTEEYLCGLIEAISIVEQPVPLHAVLFHLLFKKAFQGEQKIIVCGQGESILFGFDLQNIIFKMRNNFLYKFLQNTLMMKLFWIVQRLTSNVEVKRKLQKFKKIKDKPLWVYDEYGEKNWVCDYFRVSEYDVIKGRLKVIESYMDRPIYDVITILDLFSHISENQSILSKLGEKQGKILLFPFTESELISYAFTIPWKMKLENPRNILRSVASLHDIPEFIINRPKSSIYLNRKDWAEKGGPFEPLIPLASKIFNEREIRKLQSSDPYKARTFWNVLNYTIWKRLCINSEPVEILLKELKE